MDDDTKMFVYYILILSLPLTEHWLLGMNAGGLTVEEWLGIVVCQPH